MNLGRKTVSNLIRDEQGQALPWLAVMLTVIMGIAGFVIDLGHAMVCERQLQSSSNAAAMAGALQLPNSTYANVAHQYGSETGEANASGNLPGVAMTVSAYCSTTVKGWGIECLQPAADPHHLCAGDRHQHCAYLRDRDGCRARRAEGPLQRGDRGGHDPVDDRSGWRAELHRDPGLLRARGYSGSADGFLTLLHRAEQLQRAARGGRGIALHLPSDVDSLV
jgi:hypothetical protein